MQSPEEVEESSSTSDEDGRVSSVHLSGICTDHSMGLSRSTNSSNLSNSTSASLEKGN